MKLIKIISLAIFAISITSCFKTAEQIKREKVVDSLEVQMTDSMKMTQSTQERLQNLEDRISTLTGSVEESNHQNKSNQTVKADTLTTEIKLIKEAQTTIQDDVKNLDKRLVAQKQYLDTLLKTLSEITGKKSSKKKAKKRSKYDQAIHDYKRGSYKRAKASLLELNNDKRIKGSRRARVIHSLGMIEYIQKNYNDSVIYFSKLLTEFPKSGYNKNGLLHLARSFRNNKNNEQAIQAFTMLIDKYPKYRYRNQAIKERKKIQ